MTHDYSDDLLDSLRESPDALAEVPDRFSGGDVVGAVVCDGDHLMEPLVVDGARWGWGCWHVSHDAERLRPDELTRAHRPTADLGHSDTPVPEYERPARFCRVEATADGGLVLGYVGEDCRQLLGDSEATAGHVQRWSPNDFANPSLDLSVEFVYTQAVGQFKQASAGEGRVTA